MTTRSHWILRLSIWQRISYSQRYLFNLISIVRFKKEEKSLKQVTLCLRTKPCTTFSSNHVSILLVPTNSNRTWFKLHQKFKLLTRLRNKDPSGEYRIHLRWNDRETFKVTEEGERLGEIPRGCVIEMAREMTRTNKRAAETISWRRSGGTGAETTTGSLLRRARI